MILKNKHFSEKKEKMNNLEKASVAASLGTAAGLTASGALAGKGVYHALKHGAEKGLKTKESLKGISNFATHPGSKEIVQKGVDKGLHSAKSIQAFRRAGKGLKISAGAAAAGIALGAAGKAVKKGKKDKSTEK